MNVKGITIGKELDIDSDKSFAASCQQYQMDNNCEVFSRKRIQAMKTDLKRYKKNIDETIEAMRFPILKRDINGFQTKYRSWLKFDHVKSKKYKRVKGVIFDLNNSTMELNLEDSTCEDDTLFTQDDVDFILDNNIATCSCSLDPADGTSNFQVFQKFTVSPESLCSSMDEKGNPRISDLALTLLHADMLLKGIGDGMEISNEYPFNQRCSTSILPRLPKEVRDDLKIEANPNIAFTVARSWLDCDSVDYSFKNTANTNGKVEYMIGEANIKVKNEVLCQARVENNGTLKMETGSFDSSDNASTLWCNAMNKHFDEICRAFPIFQRLKELLKICALVVCINSFIGELEPQQNVLSPTGKTLLGNLKRKYSDNRIKQVTASIGNMECNESNRFILIPTCFKLRKNFDYTCHSLSVSKDGKIFKLGEQVLALYEDGKWYDAKIVSMNEVMDFYEIKWNDATKRDNYKTRGTIRKRYLKNQAPPANVVDSKRISSRVLMLGSIQDGETLEIDYMKCATAIYDRNTKKVLCGFDKNQIYIFCANVIPEFEFKDYTKYRMHCEYTNGKLKLKLNNSLKLMEDMPRPRYDIGDYICGRYSDGNWYEAIVKNYTNGQYELEWFDGDTSDTKKNSNMIRMRTDPTRQVKIESNIILKGMNYGIVELQEGKPVELNWWNNRYILQTENKNTNKTKTLMETNESFISFHCDYKMNFEYPGKQNSRVICTLANGTLVLETCEDEPLEFKPKALNSVTRGGINMRASLVKTNRNQVTSVWDKTIKFVGSAKEVSKKIFVSLYKQFIPVIPDASLSTTEQKRVLVDALRADFKTLVVNEYTAMDKSLSQRDIDILSVAMGEPESVEDAVAIIIAGRLVPNNIQRQVLGARTLAHLLLLGGIIDGERTLEQFDLYVRNGMKEEEAFNLVFDENISVNSFH